MIDSLYETFGLEQEALSISIITLERRHGVPAMNVDPLKNFGWGSVAFLVEWPVWITSNFRINPLTSKPEVENSG